jgi:hypothetical protein
VALGTTQALQFVTPQATVTNLTYEFRLSGMTLLATDQWVFDDGTAGCFIRANTTDMDCINHGAGGPQAVVHFGNLTDIRVRASQDGTANIWSTEVWPASGSQTGYGLGQLPSKMGAINYGGFNTAGIAKAGFGSANGGNIGFVRAYNTAVATGLRPPAENPTSKGNLWDFEFENSLTDAGPNHVAVTVTFGSITYNTNDVFNPIATWIGYRKPPKASYALFTPTFSVSLNESLTLNGSASFDSLLDNGVPTYSWTQNAGSGSFSSNVAPSPTFTSTSAGDFIIQLTVTDAAKNTGTLSGHVAGVNTDANYVIQTGQGPLWDSIMGPVTMMGTSPWPWFDLTEVAVGNTNAAYALANQLPTLGPQVEPSACTVSVSNGPFIVTGSGCHFTTDGVTTGANCTDGSTSCLIIGWTTVDGPGTGRLECGVQTIVDDNHINCQAYDGAVGVVQLNSTGSGYPIYFPGPGSVGGDPWVCGGNSANAACYTYYDTTLAYYKLYYRTGLTQYLTIAREYADKWWQWGFDHGAGLPFPRALNISSQILRALDGHNERFPAFFVTMNWYANLDNFDGPPNADNREAGYVQTFLGMLARTSLVYDTANHGRYCAWVQSSAPLWINNINSSGFVRENIFGGSAPGYPYTIVAPYESPWRSGVFGPWGMAWSYRAMSDSTDAACYNPSLATAAYSAVTTMVTSTFNLGYSNPAYGGNRGIYYDVGSGSNGNTGYTTGPGTVSISLGSTTVIGNGTQFLADGICDGTHWIGIAGGGVNSVVHRIVTCASQTQLTIDGAWGSAPWAAGGNERASQTGVQYAEAESASTSCASAAATCWNDIGEVPDGDRNLARTPPGITGLAYAQFGCNLCLGYGDSYFSSSFGGPADGPGGVVNCPVSRARLPGKQLTPNPCGPEADGYQSDVIATLPACGSHAPPCGGGASPIDAKNFGEAFGFPGADTYLANRLNGLPQPVAHLVPRPARPVRKKIVQ